MGLVKRLWMEEQERLYHQSDDAVCSDCFDDLGIKAFIEDNIECNECSVCGRTDEEPIAATADKVMEFFLERVGRYYEDANNSAPYSSAEGGWLITTWSMHEIVFNELYAIAEQETLEWLYDHLKDDVAFCERDWQILSPGQALAAGWKHFSEAIKHETRFLFFTSEKDPFDSGEPFLVRPNEILEELGKVILECNLVRKIPAGTHLFRIRGHKIGKRLKTPKDLGPPPKQFATSAGRMNAPGIVVMYASIEPKTAIREVAGQFTFYSVAEFELLQDILVVDLMQVPRALSMFEDGPRESILFLRNFTKDVSQPITPDKEIHVECTPTQVVSEYLRHRFRTSDGNPVLGVVYESAQVKHGVNAALFIESGQIERVPTESWNPKAPLLKLVNVTETRTPPKKRR